MEGDFVRCKDQKGVIACGTDFENESVSEASENESDSDTKENESDLDNDNDVEDIMSHFRRAKLMPNFLL